MDIRKFIKEKQWKKWKKDQWLILFLAGVLLLVIAIPANSGRSGIDKERGSQTQTDGAVAADEKTQTSADDYAGALEEKLEELLSQMEGVGKVRVMITLKDTGNRCRERYQYNRNVYFRNRQRRRKTADYRILSGGEHSLSGQRPGGRAVYRKREHA